MQYKKDEVRQRLISTAFKEFEKNGYYRSSIMKIATDSKVTIGNLYRYYNGKEGLFEAIVGDAYKEVPRLIMNNYALYFNGAENPLETAAAIAKALTESYNKYGREFMLLMEKSEGSKYANFASTVKTNIIHMCQFGIFKRQAGENLLLSEIIAVNFLDGLFTIFKKANAGEREEEIKKLILFYFKDASDRI